MHTKRNFQLKNICFFKSTANNNSNHLIVNTSQIMRQISSDSKNQNEKINGMCFPRVSDRAISNSSHTNRKISKIALKKSYAKGIVDIYSEFKNQNHSSSNATANKKYSNQSVLTKSNLYNELSSVSNNNKIKHFKSFTDLSNEEDKLFKSNGNMKNNIRLVLSKQMNNPSSLKSTSASKESNNNTNSIKIVNKIMDSTSNKHNTKSSSNDINDISTPEELHYYYIKTLQSGKIAETKF